MTASNAARPVMAGRPRAARPRRPCRPAPATRSPSRCEQLIPAAAMNVARPSSWESTLRIVWAAPA